MAIFNSNTILTAENLSDLSGVIYKGDFPIESNELEINFNIPGITSEHYVIDFILDDKNIQGGTWSFETSENMVTMRGPVNMDYWTDNYNIPQNGNPENIGITLTIILAKVIEQE